MESMVAMRELSCRAVEAASLKGLQFLIGQDLPEMPSFAVKNREAGLRKCVAMRVDQRALGPGGVTMLLML